MFLCYNFFPSIPLSLTYSFTLSLSFFSFSHRRLIKFLFSFLSSCVFFGFFHFTVRFVTSKEKEILRHSYLLLLFLSNKIIKNCNLTQFFFFSLLRLMIIIFLLHLAFFILFFFLPNNISILSKILKVHIIRAHSSEF